MRQGNTFNDLEVRLVLQLLRRETKTGSAAIARPEFVSVYKKFAAMAARSQEQARQATG